MEFHALVYFPDIRSEKIDIFRKKYDPKWNVIPPHITLVFPFSDYSEDHILEHVMKVTLDSRPFNIHLHGLEIIENELIFLLVKQGRDEIMNIHDQLYSGILANLEQQYVFEPHITLGELPPTEIKGAFEEAEAMNLDFLVRFDKIILIKGDGTSPAQTVATFELK